MGLRTTGQQRSRTRYLTSIVRGTSRAKITDILAIRPGFTVPETTGTLLRQHALGRLFYLLSPLSPVPYTNWGTIDALEPSSMPLN